MRSLPAILFLLLFSALSMRPVLAAEFESQIPGPALFVAPEIAVQEISVSVTRDAVTSSFILENKSPLPLEKHFAFATPPQQWFSPDFRDNGGFDDLTVSVSGNPVALQKIYSAWFGGRDISAELAAAGLPAYFDSAEGNSDSHLGKLDLNLEHPLFKKGYLKPCGLYSFGKDAWCPQWKVHQWFAFTHALPPPQHGKRLLVIYAARRIQPLFRIVRLPTM